MLFIGLRALFICIGFLNVPATARADLTPLSGAAVAPNIVEITISENGVTVAMEIYVENIQQFEDLLPDSWVPPGPMERWFEAKRLKRFAEQGLSIRIGEGATLPVTVKTIEPRMRVDRASPNAGKIDPITGRMLPKPPEDSRVIYAELFYDFGGHRPDKLEIIPPLNDEGDPILSIGMILFDRDVAVTDFRYLSAVARLTIDWGDPWYSKFDNPNLRRHHRYPAMSFIYAEPYEIRHETLMRVRDAAELLGIELKGDYLTADDRAAIDKALPSFLNDSSPMTVDGKPAKPVFERMSYLKVGPSGLIFIEDGKDLRTDAAIIGLVYSVPTMQFAKEATVEWTLFTDAIQKIPAQSIDAAGPFISELTPEEPILIWTNYFKTYEPQVIAPVAYGKERTLDVPVITILLIVLTLGATALLFRSQTISGTIRISVLGALVVAAGASTQIGWITVENPIASVPDEPSATRIAGQLIENFHNALQLKIPERLNAALDTSVSAEAFEDVKQELERAVIVEMQGGGAGIVREIRDISVVNLRAASGAGGFQASVNWSVTAFGDHWGHPHQKNIRFSALMDIAPISGAWKLTGITVTSAQPEI